MEDQTKREGQERMKGQAKIEGQPRMEVTREELLHQERIREVPIN